MKLGFIFNYFLLVLPILLFTAILSSGCGSYSNISNCTNLTSSDSTKYYVSGLMSQTELKSEWLKEKLKKNDVKKWIRNYVNKIAFDKNMDSASINQIRRQALNDYLWKWSKIEKQIIKGEDLFYYTTPKDYWDSLAGQEGIVIIKDCKILYVLVLSQS